MKITERNERAWLLREMRNAGRAPRFLSDAILRSAFQIEIISTPTTIPKKRRALVRRIHSNCLRCNKPGLVGCFNCWSGLPDNLEEKYQVAILRAAQHQGIIPNWLSDVSLAPAYRITRRTVADLTSPEPLCKNCGEPGELLCLPCFVRSQI